MAEGFSCSLNIIKLQFLIFKKILKNFCCFFSSVFGHQNLDPDPYPDSLEMLDPDSMYPDPQLWFYSSSKCFPIFSHQDPGCGSAKSNLRKIWLFWIKECHIFHLDTYLWGLQKDLQPSAKGIQLSSKNVKFLLFSGSRSGSSVLIERASSCRKF